MAIRMRRRKSREDADVPLSPLIDCVFLLLIFFLVTSVLKRFEQQIPVTLADPSAMITNDTRPDTHIMGVNTVGEVFAERGRDPGAGFIQFRRIGTSAELSAHLKTLLGPTGEPRPIELVIERETPFQTVISVLDTFQLQGFVDVRCRVREREVR